MLLVVEVVTITLTQPVLVVPVAVVLALIIPRLLVLERQILVAVVAVAGLKAESVLVLVVMADRELMRFYPEPKVHRLHLMGLLLLEEVMEVEMLQD